MSLILDALNRSRRDSTPVPGLASEHFVDGEPARWRQYLPWSALGVALLVIGGLLWERGEPPEVHAPVGDSASIAGGESAAAAPRTAPAVIEPAARGPEQGRQTGTMERPPQPVNKSADATREVDPEVARLYRQELVAPGAEAEAPVEKTPERQPEESSPQTAVTTSPQRHEQPVDIEKLVTQAREEMENARLSEHPAPFISDLSQQTKDAIPTVYYQRHDYSGSSARSSVGLNGKSLQVGGSPVPGMRVKEILPDSVVLDYRGTEFRLRALNSWINL